MKVGNRVQFKNNGARGKIVACIEKENKDTLFCVEVNFNLIPCERGWPKDKLIFTTFSIWTTENSLELPEARP